MAFDQVVTFLYTGDLDASSRFYGEILELPLVLDQGACRIYRTSPYGFLGVCNHKGPPKDPDSAIVTLVSQDVAGWAERLRAKGVTFEKEPTFYERFNITHLFIRDPSGYLVEIQTFHDPTWPTD